MISRLVRCVTRERGPGADRSRRAARVRVTAVAGAISVLSACGGSDGPDSPPATTSALTAVGPQCPAGDPAGHGAVEGPGPRGPVPRAPFLVDPNSQPAQVARQNPAAGTAAATIATRPLAYPVGDWLGDSVQAQVAARAAEAERTGSTAVFMVYAIPHRDVSAGFSAGGLPDAGSYRAFTRKVAAGIGHRNAVIVLEPDSLAQLDHLGHAEQEERYQLLNDAVDVYGGLSGTSVYLDGANCGWTDAPVIADRLERAGVQRARGFAVNVSNYYHTQDEVARADVISGLTGGSHFVVDTSRNGRGPASGDLKDAWCNPPGRGLGITPTTDTGNPRADAFLWIKVPGASDGECGRNNPSAGTWWPAQADELVRNATS
ncbi:glycoside hydrolase family 6 protein [Protofrankia coriariae]|uniref:Glucanase n=1 Tax=Protofrankia coriariae TaxID=1562887 RepID=A0ABR5EZC8_9ACTN|nr:glycoside hydrolase family 6 protein [Protofrankia coriariae]KLL09818.1 endoglucanase [Protofrankia coriariae]